MNGDRSRPPTLAVWLLRRICPKRNQEAITGDLLERFPEGHSGGWFWRQVLVAIFVGVLSEWRRHWIELCFALTGTALIGVPWELIFPASLRWFHLFADFQRWGQGLRWPFDAPFLAFGVHSGAWPFYTVSVFNFLSALLMLPVFVLFLIFWKSTSKVNLVLFVGVCTGLLIAGDLPEVFWILSHPVIRVHSPQSPAAFWIALRVGWTFAALLMSAGIVHRRSSESVTISA